MNLMSPAKACKFLNGFNNRIERLKINDYSDNHFFTYDINRLKEEIKKINLVCSIAIHNKNKDSALFLINITKYNINIARELLFNNKK
jgi:hypothetical protein